jgi:hypothetical protein
VKFIAEQGEQQISFEARRENALRQMYENLSKPQLTVREELGARYQEKVLVTDQPNVIRVKKYDKGPDPTPSQVLLDDNGRAVEIKDIGRILKYAYDENGYLINASQDGIHGIWSRYFTYRMAENGKKELAKLQVMSYESIDIKRQRGKMQVVNFDPTGKPDNLIDL